MTWRAEAGFHRGAWRLSWRGMSLSPSPPRTIRDAVVRQVRLLVGGTGDDTVERNRADTGLFGPDSACKRPLSTEPSKASRNEEITEDL